MHSVVIADDEKLICDGIRSIIQTELPDLTITHVFEDGSMIYEYLEAHEPDIVICDIAMPGKSGLDVARLVEAKGHNSYVIIITAHQLFEYAKEAINAKVDAFLTKPFSTQQLLETLQKALSYINRKHTTITHNRSSHRALIQALCNNTADTLFNTNIYLCNGTAQLKELQCTEVLFQNERFLTLASDKKDTLIRTLTDCVEDDTDSQSSFYLGSNDVGFTVLIFSKKEPLLNFVSHAEKIINSYTGNSTDVRTKTFQSLSEYRMQQTFSLEMNAFLSTLAEAGSIQAKKQLLGYIHSLPSHQYPDFVQFMSENYQIALPDSGSDINEQCLNSLTSHAVETHSGNYIVNAAKEYIYKNYASSSLSLNEISDALSISSYYLSRIFMKHTGQNFSEYLLQFRMNQAQKLLKTTHLSTIEISAAVGYNNPSYFRTSFKTHFGITPRQYRMLQNNEE